MLDRFDLDPLSAFDDGLGGTEGHISRRHIVQSLAITFAIIMLHEVFDLKLQVAQFEVVCQQHAVNKRLMSSRVTGLRSLRPRSLHCLGFADRALT